MAYPSLTFRGTSLQTTDQTAYTFSGMAIGNPSPLRAVVVFIQFTTFSGSQPTLASISGVTIGGVNATYLAIANSNTTSAQAAYMATVPEGTTADIVVTFTIAMTRCYIGYYTLKPASTTPVDTVTFAASGTDITMTDISVVTDGVVLVGLNQSVTSTNLITWTGVDGVNTDLAMTAVDGTGFYASFLNIQPTETVATNDLLFSSAASPRRYYIALSFGVQGKLQDTLTEAVGMAELQVLNTAVYSSTYTEGAAIIAATRYTPVQSLEETLSEIIGAADLAASAFPVVVDEFIDIEPLVGVPVEEAVWDTVDFFTEMFEYGWGLAVTDNTEFTENELSYYYVRGATVTEGIGVGESASMGGRYIAVVAERAGIRRVLIVALPVTVSETVGVQYAESVVRGVRVIERLGLSEQLLNKLTLNRAFTDSVRLSDSLLRFFAGDVVDGVSFTDLLARQRVLKPTLTDTTGINDSLTKQFILRVIAADTVALAHTDALKMLFRPTLADGIELAAAYISPGNSVTTWAINTKTMAATEYTNYSFNSFAQMGHKYLGATSDGLYELQGDTDNGTDIIADIKSGLMQLGGSRFSSFKTAYIGMRGEGNFVLKIETGDGKFYNYAVIGKDMQTSRVHFGKGLRARYFAFELISTGQDFDLDSIEFIPLVVQRRV